jgi:single-strand DNA-binding protein
MSHQSTLIVGFLGADPQMDYTASGQARTRFSVATNRKYKKAEGQEIKETTWFKVTAWAKQAEACNAFLHKGSLVLVEGRLVPDPDTGGPHIWTRQDGSPAASFEISAETVRFLNGKNGNANGETVSEQDAEIPF